MIEDSTIDVGQRDTRGRTALHLAAELNNLPKVEELLSQGADVRARDNAKRTPLCLAVENNKDESHFNVIEKLLINGSDTNPRGVLESPLFNLVKRGNLKTVELFLSFKANVNALGHTGENLLFSAASFNHKNWEILELLIELGLDLNQRNCSKKTPLHSAAAYNKDESHLKIFELLLKNGADVKARDKYGRTPINYLAKTGNVKILRLLLSFMTNIDVVEESGCNLLFPATMHNKDPEVLQLLMDLGFNPNERDTENKNPLHYAAMRNRDDSNFEVAKMLLKNGANVNSRDDKAKTPLYHLVAEEGNTRIVKLFLDFKADVKTTDKHDCNLLLPAARCNNHKVVQLLIDLGLNVNQANQHGTTAMHCASVNRPSQQIKIFKCLAKNGANANAVDREGVTPLVEALFKYESSQSEPEVIKKNFEFLLEHSDFEVVHNDVNVLTFYYKTSQSYLWRMVLEHLAKLKSLGVPVHPDFIRVISENDKYRDYYEECNRELSLAKSTKFNDSWVSFYNLVVDSRRRLKNYSGNQALIKEFEDTDCLGKFLIYGARMQAKVKKGLRRRELFDESMDLLSYCLPIFNPTHLIISDVLDCVLSKKDLSKFCE